MRRLALLLAGGALWIVFSAAPVFADGGPHQLTLNNGTSGLSGDCAACHRAHTAQAADLLKAAMPGLCTTCHDGTGATTDVLDGVQYVPTGTTAFQQSTVLGALRGGGFDYALIDTGDASRLTYNSRGGIVVTFDAKPSSGTVVLNWPAFTGFAGGSITIDPNVATCGTSSTPVCTAQTAVDALFLTSTTYTSSTAAGNMSSATTSNMLVSIAANSTTGVWTITFNPQNEFRLVLVGTPTIPNGGDTTGQNAEVANLLQANMGQTSKVGAVALADKLTHQTTSTHEGAGTVWGNGPQGQGNAGATGVVLECTNCHNPHGNGQYRILQTTPGEDWSNGTNGVADWNPPLNAVEVKDVGSTASTKNYTILPAYTGSGASAVVSYQAADVHGTPTQGDYFRYKYDPSGAANFTNFYLKSDQMNTGWNGIKPTNKAANGNVAPPNTDGLMTAWCISCHTRYNGYTVDANGLIVNNGGASSLNKQMPSDATFMYKHGTARIGCEQCHVSHGTDAAMTAEFSSTYEFPDGSAEDSALLKVNNRGTCNLCHDPTHTVTAGTTVGTVPGAITPGP